MKLLLKTALAAVALALPAAPASAQIEDVVAQLNEPILAVSDGAKSYQGILDAYLALSDPPKAVGPGFNMDTIWPGMDGWAAVADWASSNEAMGVAVIEGGGQKILIFGLPYGNSIEQRFVDAKLVARIGYDDDLRNIDFPYLDAIDTIGAYVAAETYRLHEAGQHDEAMNLAIGFMWIARHLCDRQMVEEMADAFTLLMQSLELIRDQVYAYRDDLSKEMLIRVAKEEIPFLKPDYRYRLLQMPEGHRIVSEAILRSAFYGEDAGANAGQPDAESFARIFAELQSRDEPLTRFGAAKRWRAISLVHGSLDASLERLTKIYDDWWRRWRMDPYNSFLDLSTELERTNEIRYGGVVHSIVNIQSLFDQRIELVASVNATALVAGLVAFEKEYGVYPDDYKKVYSQFVRKNLSDLDPWDEQLGTFKFIYLGEGSTRPIRTVLGQVEAESCIIYSRAADHSDDRAEEHVEQATGSGDWIVWPAIRVLEREAGFLN